jgi:hypothetical protein
VIKSWGKKGAIGLGEPAYTYTYLHSGNAAESSCVVVCVSPGVGVSVLSRRNKNEALMPGLSVLLNSDIIPTISKLVKFASRSIL